MLQIQLALGPEDIPSEVSSSYNWSRLHGTSFSVLVLNRTKTNRYLDGKSNQIKKKQWLYLMSPSGRAEWLYCNRFGRNRFDILEMCAITIT